MFVFQTKKCTCANILRDVDFIPMDAFHKMFVVRVNFYPKKKYLVVVFSCFSQKHKVRLIDDFTQSGVNHFVTAHEEPSLHTVDIADSTITVWMQICSSNRSPSELIKTFDLSSTYKQIALSEAGRKVAYISVWDPFEKRPRYFRSLALPFGAVRSVHSFLSVAR